MTTLPFRLKRNPPRRCYVRAAYCDGERDKNDLNNWKVVVSERIEGAINLGDTAIRSLKEAGVPDGAAVQVGPHFLREHTRSPMYGLLISLPEQLVVEMVAAGHPMLFSAEEWTYSEDSLRTGTYKVSGTVFNPKLEREVRRRPPPPPPPMQMQMRLPEDNTPREMTPLLSEKGLLRQEEQAASSHGSFLASIQSCMLCI